MKRTRGMTGRTILWMVAVGVLCTLMGPPASADVNLRIQDVTIQSHPTNPVTGTIEAYINLTDADLASPPSITGYQLGLKVDGSGEVMLTDAAFPTVSFVPISPFTDSLVSSVSSPPELDAANTELPLVNALLGDGAGLFAINFEVAPGTLGTFTVSHTKDINNMLESFVTTDSAGSRFEFDSLGLGTITVVPEPTTMALAGLGAGYLVLAGYRRRRQSVS